MLMKELRICSWPMGKSKLYKIKKIRDNVAQLYCAQSDNDGWCFFFLWSMKKSIWESAPFLDLFHVGFSCEKRKVARLRNLFDVFEKPIHADFVSNMTSCGLKLANAISIKKETCILALPESSSSPFHWNAAWFLCLVVCVLVANIIPTFLCPFLLTKFVNVLS